MKNIFITLLLILGANAEASVKKSKIEFSAVGKPAFIKINGDTKISDASIDLKDNKISGNFIVDLSNITTGIELRDEHLKENYLEIKKYPQAILSLKDVILGEKDQSVKGELELHGVKKEVEITISALKNGSEIEIESSFPVLLKDFSVEIPSFKGITVANKVNIKVNGKFGI